MPRRVANSTVRSLTSSSGCGVVMSAPPQATCAPSPRSYGERVGVRGIYQRSQEGEEYAESSLHPDRKCDIAEALLRRSFQRRPPKAAFASPRKRGEVKKTATL